MIGVVSLSRHNAVVAQRDEARERSEDLHAENRRLKVELRNTQAALAKFTGPRTRGPGGRFVKGGAK